MLVFIMKHVLVTGASSGIGRACCRYLLQLDMSVLGIARRSISMTTSDTQPPHFYSILADLTDESCYQRISSFYSEHAIDTIDYIIICAAKIDPITPLLSAQGDDLISNFTLNVLSPLYLFQSLQRYFNRSRILFVGSDSAHNHDKTGGFIVLEKRLRKCCLIVFKMNSILIIVVLGTFVQVALIPLFLTMRFLSLLRHFLTSLFTNIVRIQGL